MLVTFNYLINGNGKKRKYEHVYDRKNTKPSMEINSSFTTFVKLLTWIAVSQ